MRRLCGACDYARLIEAAEAALLADQPAKELRLQGNEQCEHEADGQTQDRARGHSAHSAFCSPFVTSHLRKQHRSRDWAEKSSKPSG